MRLTAVDVIGQDAPSDANDCENRPASSRWVESG